LSVSLFVPVIAGLTLARPRTGEALAAMLAGLAALAAARGAGWSAVSRLLDPTLVALVVSALAFLLARALCRRGRSIG
ncbi:MAG: hypothetical protein R3195_14020, partial [Gemmatimonadota bacterium]|nr:hypothetical protein [Gemmatimonadota bacterium]